MTPLTACKLTSHLTCHRFAVLGGDTRMRYVAERLSEAGCPVVLCGCGGKCLPCEEKDGAITLCASPERAVEAATDIVLPLPASRDGETVSVPRDPGCHIPLSALFDTVERREDLCLYGGCLPEAAMTGLSPSARLRVTDYYESEALQIRNALITAEGAIMRAMELTDCMLEGSTVAVIGYGRIGRFLCRRLLSLGADVTLVARREEALLYAEAEGCHPLRLGDSRRVGGGLYPLCYGHSVIFNTVPARVLDRELLMRMERDTLLLDLASAPFCASDDDIREAGMAGTIRYVRAPSLPGSYAPRDAGHIIAACILDEICRRQREKDHREAENTRGGRKGEA